MLSTLIVEDNAAHRRSLLRLLEGRFPSMRIDEAADGREALRQAVSRHFDLIFMDIRLPHGNGLDLTKAIKTISADTMICVITSYDILEYREAAFRNGADHFMVKGETSATEILDLVDALLRTRFVTLIMVSDSLSCRQLNTLLSIRWPAMVVAEAGDAATGLDQVTVLKPDLVLLELGLPDVSAAELVRDIRTRIPQTTLIGMTDDVLPVSRTSRNDCVVDYYVPLTPMGYTELMEIVGSLQPKRMHH
ncbi:MAG: response regulator [Hyphomicrobiaceae bacterium]